MIIFSTTTGDEQVIVYNLGDGSVCHGSYSWTLADSGATYDATREFKVNFNTGEITHRQKKGNNSTWSTYTVARYL